MTTEILLSKLVPPRIDKEIIDRPRLLQLLAGIENRKITLFMAPAGFGKTVSMLQFANATGRLFLWYQLDTYDNDLAVFVQYLAAGLQRLSPAFESNFQLLIEQGNIESRLRLLVTSLVNGLLLDVNQPLLLMMDDFHVLHDPLVLRLIQDLLEHLPSHIHVMLTSRVKPPLAFPRFKTAGKILTIGTDELRFTEGETRTFLGQKSRCLSMETESLLKQKINGWPALVRLAADSTSALRLTGDHSEIYQYLATEVLEQQPDNIKEYLLKTAVFEVITAAESDLLLKRNDSESMLSLLENQNLFLIPLNEVKKSYRYHQLFREFLLEKLGPERRLLQRDAGFIAWNRGDLTAAIEYFVAAEAEAEFIAALKDAGQQALRQGRWQTVHRWLKLLSRKQIAANSWLALFQAQVEAYRGQMVEASGWIEKASPLFAATGDRLGLAESQLLKARILRYQGFYELSLELLEEAYPYLQSETNKLRFDLPLEKSICLVMTGRFKEAEVLVKRALTEAECENDNYIIAYLLGGLGNIYYLEGEYAKSLQIYHKRVEISPERNLPDYYTHNYIAAIYQEWGELDQAYEYARLDVAAKENLGLTESLPSAYFQMADIYLNRRELKEAEDYFRRAIQLIEKTSGEHFFLIVNKTYLARCLSVQGRLAEAQVLVEEALAEALTPSGLALAICRELAAPIFWTYGKKNEAKDLLTLATATLEKMGFPRPLCHAYAAFAMFYTVEGDRDAAAFYARKTLELSAKKNFCQSYLVSYEIFQPILQFGLVQGIEVTFIQKVLVRLGKRALPFLGSLAQHPSPEVRRRLLPPLGEIGGEQAVSILQSFKKDPDPVLRQLAEEILQRLELITAEPPHKTASHTLEFKTLGPPQISLAGTEPGVINWRTTKARDLLAFLAHKDKPVSQEIILEDLWFDYDPEKAKGLFHTSLYYLRQVFKKMGLPNLIIYRNNHYQLATGSFVEDRAQFQELVSAGLRGEIAPEKACDLLERAISLYRGDYLAELDYPWLLPHRENLKSLYGEARIWLARYYLQTKKSIRAIGHLRMLVDLNPLNEEPHRLLMMAYAELGDMVAINEEYQSLKELLGRELGLTPTKETQQLFIKLFQEKSK
jgi:LuxR family transcriptional regulator, maltose regulon positive regulatory protein